MTDPRLETDRNIWLATTRPDGRPHLTPIWFVCVNEKIYVCTQSKAVKAKNVLIYPSVAFSLEDGNKPLIGEGTALIIKDDYPENIIEAFKNKYNWDFPSDPGYTVLIEIVPRKWLKW